MISKSRQLKILLVDDQPLVTRAHCAMLEDMGYAPDAAISGEEAVIKAVNGYDVIFMDINLPGISGIEAAAEIRGRESAGKQVYIIALSTYVSEEIEEKCRLVGINLVKTKPISAAEMQALLSRLFE